MILLLPEHLGGTADIEFVMYLTLSGLCPQRLGGLVQVLEH